MSAWQITASPREDGSTVIIARNIDEAGKQVDFARAAVRSDAEADAFADSLKARKPSATASTIKQRVEARLAR